MGAARKTLPDCGPPSIEVFRAQCRELKVISCSKGAERKRQYRRRRKGGLVVLPVVVDLVRLEIMLLDLGKIDRAADDDRAALAAAVASMIGEMIEAYERGAGRVPP